MKLASQHPRRGIFERSTAARRPHLSILEQASPFLLPQPLPWKILANQLPASPPALALADSVKEAFCRLHSKGLVYRGTYMVNWSPHLQTAVSDLEVEYSDENGHLYFFQYPVESGEGFLPVATTRPETILGDTAVAVHPEVRVVRNARLSAVKGSFFV